MPVKAKQQNSTCETPESIRERKVRALRERGYRRVWVDSDGRICVEVDDSDIWGERAALFRRVWGPEWPVVRSERWMNILKPTPEAQFQFQSRD